MYLIMEVIVLGGRRNISAGGLCWMEIRAFLCREGKKREFVLCEFA